VARYSSIWPRAEASPRQRARWLIAGIVAVATILIAMMWGVTAVSVMRARAGAIESTRAEAQNLAAVFENEVARTMDRIADVLDLMAQRMRREGGAFDVYRWVQETPVLKHGGAGVAILGPDGILLASSVTPAQAPVDLSDREHFQVHLDTRHHGLHIGAPVLGRVSKVQTVQVTQRVNADDGRFLGVTVFSLLPSYLTNLHRSLDLGPRGVLVLTGTDDIVRARFTAEKPDGTDGLGTYVAGGARPSGREALQKGHYQRASVVDGVARLYAYHRVTGHPLIVTVGLELDNALEAANDHALVLVLLATLATLLVAGLATYLVREISRRAARETELASANVELMLRKEQAEAANVAKSTFLANMSHELRTPLNAIIGFSEVIRDQAMGPVGLERYSGYAADIAHAGQHLLGIINDVLDISRIEAGKLDMATAAVEVAGTIADSIRAVTPQAERKRLVITLVEPIRPIVVVADEQKLRQVLTNLLSNAVKFTPEGGRVTVSSVQQADGGVRLSVVDTGIGMDQDEIGLALQPFRQLENALTKSHEGTGLGLPLAKRLVELHGGRLEIESARGQGTVVHVLLPAVDKSLSVAA
jgi:signal transduction histidine kinase